MQAESVSTAAQDRDLRQRDIIPPGALAESRCTVVGVGAIGRQVALQLAAIGVPWLQLIDFDTVETVNLAPQGFRQRDLGLPKVDAVADAASDLNPQVKIHKVNDRFRRSLPVGSSIWCCVDSITTRRLIWEAMRDEVSFFVDGRMSAEVVRVLTVAGLSGRDYYATTLFAADEAYRGACTARSTIFTASIAAGLMIEQFARHLRRLPSDTDLQLNLLSSELSVSC